MRHAPWPEPTAEPAQPAVALLPAPASERWKPLRAGLVDMFYYDQEEFWFHDGRLLLRGNNGTGKSKVLALTLPFLLDGELAPHRVEPDGDRQKRMEWNLMLGGRYPSPERLGYTWLEFGRRAADGAEEFRTIGCGLKAVAGRGIVRHWFFVTSRRVGGALHLLPTSRVPLTREKLREELGQDGLVYDRASDYRRAVDENLFGLGEHRYEALVNLLIQLRQPQLSKKPDEKLLSRALTEALPPLSPGLVTTVAEAFRGLDEERDALRSLAEAQQAAEDFLRHYRRYAMVAAKRKAAGPRATQSRYEQLGRDLAAAEEAFTAAQRELADAQGELSALEEQRTELEARRDALRADPAMRDAERLEHLREDAARREKSAQDREKDRDRLAGQVHRHVDKVGQAVHRAGTGRDRLARALGEAASAADAARCDRPHQATVAPLDGAYLEAAEAAAAEMLAAARREAQAIAGRQEQAAARLAGLLDESADRQRQLRKARDEEARLSAEVQAAADRVTGAEDTTAERMRLLLDAYRSYLAGLAELRVADPEELIAALESWGVSGDGANLAAVVIDDAARAAGAELGRLAGELGTRRAGHISLAGELSNEIGRLRAGGHDAPPAPHTRGPGVRDGRPGAPLWKVTDFAPGLSDGERAGLEAALEAAGILDAWVTPEGNLIDGDVIVASGLSPATGPSCADVLLPAIDLADPRAAAVGAESVGSVLRAIGLGAGNAGIGQAWVTTDGRWSNGVLSGDWRKDQAGYIGEGAREAARRARITLLEGELAEERAAIAGIDAGLADIAARRELLADEHRAVPADDGVREAHTVVAEQRKQLGRARADHAAAVIVCARRQEELAAARARATEFAQDVDLPADSDELATVRAGVGAYREALAGLWPAADAAHAAIRAAADAEAELAEDRQLLTEAGERAAEAREGADAAATAYGELLATVGTAVKELQRRLGDVISALGIRQNAERTARSREQQAIEDRGKADGKRGELRTHADDAARQRDDAVRDFQAFAATGLLRVAVSSLDIPDAEQPWAATPTVILARAVNTELDAVDDGDGPWDRIQRRVTEEHKLLADAMAARGHSAGLTLSEGVIVIDVVFQGRRHDLPGLAAALQAEVEQRTTLLSAREREILENHLLNEVAGTLHELIATAEAEVRQMNDELELRPTSTGMKLRLIWQQARNAPEGLDRIRLKLRQTIDAWSAADRGLVGAFLQQRIAAEHADNPASGWAEALTAALDYRNWHEFVIQRYQEGQWRPATGPASGGERALVASVPLFAAASSHYKSAGNPHAPRLIALDEAFAGVDDDSRAKCLGLLATFDMDVVMTSEREWGCYPQLPGLGICQLARQDGVDAVLVTPWRWDGRERPAGRPGGGVTDAAEPGRPDETGRLRRLLGGEPVAWLVGRVRDRLEAGRPLTGTVTLADATVEQRRAVERLTGRAARSGTSLSVSLTELDRILRSSGAAPGGLEEAVTALTGPVRDRERDRADTAVAWAAAFAPLDEIVDRRAELSAWRAWLDATGVVRRLAPEPAVAGPLLLQVAAVLRRLPSGGVPIGRLAAECCGDAHALDDGRPAGTLILSAARAMAGQPFAADGGADSRRAAWAAVGVHLDELSSLVLCLGLLGDAHSPLGRVLELHREAGQPAVVTLRQLRCHDKPLRAGPVRVCENPVVVAAAADELGGRCQPLVCVGGHPSAAGWLLLDILSAGGAQFRYHGDFDWGGIRIASAVRDRAARGRAPWLPWRYDRDTYEALAATVPGTGPPGTRLVGEPVATPWDPALAAAMTGVGLRVEEELSIDTLLADLDR